MSSYTLVFVFTALVSSCVSFGLNEQCGGEGYTGPTKCTWPLECFRQSRWFSSCQISCPGAGWECMQSSSENNLKNESSIRTMGYVSDDIFGRRTTAYMLGSTIFDQMEYNGDSLMIDNVYDLVVTDIVEFLETEEPGSMAELGRAMQSDDVYESIDLWTVMSDRVDIVSESPELAEYVFSDPLFWELVQSNDFYEEYSTHSRSVQSRSLGCNGPIPNLGAANGKYGDSKYGRANYVELTALLTALNTFSRTVVIARHEVDLSKIDNQGIRPADIESRLGAYYATRGYSRGTIGYAVHQSIGGIYRLLGTIGEERIGRVFNDKRAIALYKDPVYSPSSLCMGEIEHRYWQNVFNEDNDSIGGRLGSSFHPSTRDKIQKRITDILTCTSSFTDAYNCVSQLLPGKLRTMASSKSSSVDEMISNLKENSKPMKIDRILNISSRQNGLFIPAGYTRTSYICMKKPVYCNSKASSAMKCIVEDRTSHKGGVWKAGPEKKWADSGCSPNGRSGTYDANLQWIAP